jgi:hypothetical protein
MKRFKSFITEMADITMDDVRFDFSKHFDDRTAERAKGWGVDEVKAFVKKIVRQIRTLGNEGKYFFYSRSLKRGAIAAWDKANKVMKMITLYPYNDDRVGPGARKIIVESIEYTIVEID